MRRDAGKSYRDIKIIACDDDQGIVDGVKVQLNRIGLDVICTTDPDKLIIILKDDSFDILILDYLFDGTDAEHIVKTIREFDKLIYIIILTGHESIYHPFEVLSKLEVQNFCEKSDRYDAFKLQVLSAVNVVRQRKYFSFVEFGETVRQLREEKNLSKIDLANLLKVSRKTISEWENGFYLPKSEVLIQLCHILKTTPNVLLGIGI